MGRLVRRIGIVLTAFAVMLLSGHSVVSAAASDVGVQPAYPREGNTRSESIFIMALEPGETGKNGVRLINSGEESHTVQIYAVDGTSAVDGSFSCRQKAEEKKEVGNWVALSQDQITIEPDERVIVDFEVTPPAGTEPGEHNGCIAIQDLANLPAESGEGILLGFRSAIRLAITVAGDIIKKLELDDIRITQSGSTYEVMPIVTNTGNVSLDVKSHVQLESIFGQKTEIKSDATCPVVPGATQACGYSFERPYWGGFYRAKVSVSYNADPNDGLGENVGKQTKVSRTSGFFFAVPDPLAALAELAVLAGIIWLVVSPLRRKARRRKLMRTWEKYVIQDPSETIMSIAAARGAKWRRIARVNHLKAPYALQVGKPIIVPKPKASAPAKAKKQRKKRQSELDWFLDSEPSAPAPQAEAPKPTADAPLMEPITPPAERVVPSSPPELPTPPAPQPMSPPPQSTWANPVYGPAPDDFTRDETYVDWREGADVNELQDIEQRLGDYTAVPRIKAHTPAPKKKPARASTKKTSAKKQPKPKKRS